MRRTSLGRASMLFALIAPFPAPIHSSLQAPPERQASAPAPQGASQAGICAADLRRHLEVLASDELQGRAFGSPEAMKAATYLAAELARFGVEPAGEDGTYFQKVPVERTEFLAVPKLACADGRGVSLPCVAGVDFDLVDGGSEARTLKVVYAAAATEIPAPDAGTALVLLTEKASDRVAWLKTAGNPEGAGFGLIVSMGFKDPGSRPMERPPRPRGKAPGPTPRISARGALREAFAARRVATLTFEAPIRVQRLEAANVVGRLRGSVAVAGGTEEYVQFSAHYDHLAPRQGEGSPATGAAAEDRIFNGADDDASGCAVVLELAEQFAHEPRPARTLLFFFATGEEAGLVGTYYSIERPLVPLERMVLDVNFEMLGRPDPKLVAPVRMWLTGYERSNLGPELARLGMPVVADPRPEQNFFERSDNFALAKRGIVAQTLSSFGLHTDYHGVDDEVERIDFEHLESCARTAYAGCRSLADGSFRPAWVEGKDPSKAEPRRAPAPKNAGGDTGANRGADTEKAGEKPGSKPKDGR